MAAALLVISDVWIYKQRYRRVACRSVSSLVISRKAGGNRTLRQNWLRSVYKH